VHAKLVSAFKKKDLDGIMALSTKDFTEEDSQGKKYTAQQSANEMKQHFAMMKGPMNVEMAMSKLAVKGDTASYTSTFKMSGSMLDKDGIMGPKGKTHTMAGSGVETIELAKQQGAWKYKHVKGISQKMLLDGKPYNPGAQPPPHSGRPQNPHKAKP
jgi:ketosteroid isomerase-like protein